MANVVANRYAAALYDASEEGGRLSRVFDELMTLKGIMCENSEFIDFLKHPKISFKDKKDILGKTIGSKFDEYIVNLFNLMIDKDRFGDIMTVMSAFDEIYKERQGIVDVNVTSGVELEDYQKDKLEMILHNKFNKKINLIYMIDSTIIGGLKIEAQGKVIDSSVRGELAQIKKYINDISLG